MLERAALKVRLAEEEARAVDAASNQVQRGAKKVPNTLLHCLEVVYQLLLHPCVQRARKAEERAAKQIAEAAESLSRTQAMVSQQVARAAELADKARQQAEEEMRRAHVRLVYFLCFG